LMNNRIPSFPLYYGQFVFYVAVCDFDTAHEISAYLLIPPGWEGGVVRH
jgi:hypothetical protein